MPDSWDDAQVVRNIFGDKLVSTQQNDDPIPERNIRGILGDCQENVYTIVKGSDGDSSKDIALEALGDMMIVVEDRFRTGFECTKCDGYQHVGERCKWCAGSGVEPGTVEKGAPQACRKCGNTGFKGYEPCDQCGGKGGILIAPDIAQRRPTTGVVTSVGPDVKHIKVGDRVLYSLFSGNAIEFKQKVIVRNMHEHEAYNRIHGLGRIGDLVK